MPAEPANRRFATTRWSVVIAAGDARSPDGQTALATLCETYWYPVYAFIRRSGRSSDEARDLTQAFFTRLLEKNVVRDAKQERGRFRSFLLTSVRHFVANEHEHDRALKRGGRSVHVPFEFEDGERQYRYEPVDNETPERIYERHWAQTVLDAARDLAASKFEGARRRALFDRLKPFVVGEEPPSYEDLARELDLTEGAVRVAVHRLRRQVGDCLRELIAETVGHPEDVDDELRFLLNVLSR
jgi:RNA polymerase sigma factor (sigma-70 family)